jgi:hypothetical protein
VILCDALEDGGIVVVDGLMEKRADPFSSLPVDFHSISPPKSKGKLHDD